MRLAAVEDSVLDENEVIKGSEAETVGKTLSEGEEVGLDIPLLLIKLDGDRDDCEADGSA